MDFADDQDTGDIVVCDLCLRTVSFVSLYRTDMMPLLYAMIEKRGHHFHWLASRPML